MVWLAPDERRRNCGVGVHATSRVEGEDTCRRKICVPRFDEGYAHVGLQVLLAHTVGDSTGVRQRLIFC